jgi:hypothetical protein
MAATATATMCRMTMRHSSDLSGIGYWLSVMT